MTLSRPSSTVRPHRPYFPAEVLTWRSIRGPGEVPPRPHRDLPRLVHREYSHQACSAQEQGGANVSQYYKVPRGDDLIPIVGDTYQNASFIVDVLEESHGYWEELVAGTVDTGKINYNQTSQEDLESFVSRCDTYEELGIPRKNAKEKAAKVPEKYTWWYYLDEEHKLIELPESS